MALNASTAAVSSGRGLSTSAGLCGSFLRSCFGFCASTLLNLVSHCPRWMMRLKQAYRYNRHESSAHLSCSSVWPFSARKLIKHVEALLELS